MDKTKAPIRAGQRGLQPADFEGIMRLCHAFYQANQESNLKEERKRTEAEIILCVSTGMEVGLGPAASFQNIAVINGVPSIWGDALPGLAYAGGNVEYIEEFFEGDFDKGTLTAVCLVKRKDERKEHREEFSITDAKRANLWKNTKKFPWITDPKGMLRRRAKARALRTKFPDVLCGIVSREEAEDYEPMEPRNVTPAAELNKQLSEPEVIQPEDYEDSAATEDAKAKQPDNDDLDAAIIEQDAKGAGE